MTLIELRERVAAMLAANVGADWRTKISLCVEERHWMHQGQEPARITYTVTVIHGANCYQHETAKFDDEAIMQKCIRPLVKLIFPTDAYDPIAMGA